MAFDPTEPTAATVMKLGAIRGNFGGLGLRVDGLPEDYTGLEGRPVVVSLVPFSTPSGTRLAITLADPSNPMRMGGAGLSGFEVEFVDPDDTASTLTLDSTTRAARLGKWTRMNSASAQTVTIQKTLGDGFTGIVQQSGNGQTTLALGSNCAWAEASQATKISKKGGKVSIVTKLISSGATLEVTLSGDLTT